MTQNCQIIRLKKKMLRNSISCSCLQEQGDVLPFSHQISSLLIKIFSVNLSFLSNKSLKPFKNYLLNLIYLIEIYRTSFILNWSDYSCHQISALYIARMVCLSVDLSVGLQFFLQCLGLSVETQSCGARSIFWPK